MTIYSLVILLSKFEPVSCYVSSSNYCILICVQVSQEAGKVVWHPHFFKIFPQCVVIHTVKSVNVVNEAAVFLEFSCFLFDPTNVGNLILVPLSFQNCKTQFLHVEVPSSGTYFKTKA